MFRVFTNMQDKGTYDSYVEAFKIFMNDVEASMKKGTSLQILETAFFVVYEKNSKIVGLMGFYAARDFSYSIGLMHDSKLQEGVPEPENEVIEIAFEKSMRSMLEYERQMMISMIEDLLVNVKKLV